MFANLLFWLIPNPLHNQLKSKCNMWIYFFLSLEIHCVWKLPWSKQPNVPKMNNLLCSTILNNPNITNYRLNIRILFGEIVQCATKKERNLACTLADSKNELRVGEILHKIGHNWPEINDNSMFGFSSYKFKSAKSFSDIIMALGINEKHGLEYLV